MSLCNDCTTVNSIPECAINLTIGTIVDLGRGVIVYFHDQALDRIKTISATSDGVTGAVVVDLSLVSWITSNRCYKIWVGYDDSTDLEETQLLTIGGDTANCILLNFSDVKPLTITDYTLAV